VPLDDEMIGISVLLITATSAEDAGRTLHDSHA
jgi:hypothetical protein